MAASKDKPKPPVIEPWDLAEEDFDDSGPRTIIARAPGPPGLQPGDALEGEPDAADGPVTIPGRPIDSIRPPAPQPSAPPPSPREVTQPHYELPPSPPARMPAPPAPPPAPRKITGSVKAAEPPRQPAPPPPAVLPPQVSPKKSTGMMRTIDPPPAAVLPPQVSPKKPTGMMRTIDPPPAAVLPPQVSPKKPTGMMRTIDPPPAAVLPPQVSPKKPTGMMRTIDPPPAAVLPPGISPKKPSGTMNTVEPELGSLPTSPPKKQTGMLRTLHPAPGAGPGSGGGGQLGDDDDEGPTQEKPAVGAGAFSRRLAKDAASEAKSLGLGAGENTATGVAPMDPAAKRRLQTLMSLGALLFGGLALYLTIQYNLDRPSSDELQLVYPYGFDGMRGPHGESAPGAPRMKFKLVDEVPCGTHALCLRYAYRGDNGFTGSMVVGKTASGTWERASDEGCPFPPPHSRP